MTITNYDLTKSYEVTRVSGNDPGELERVAAEYNFPNCYWEADGSSIVFYRPQGEQLLGSSRDTP